MARNLREVIAAVQAERRAKTAAAYKQKLIAEKEEAAVGGSQARHGGEGNSIASWSPVPVVSLLLVASSTQLCSR
jgi:hypothetical protein